LYLFKSPEEYNNSVLKRGCPTLPRDYLKFKKSETILGKP
jgi:hypothetical protein